MSGGICRKSLSAFALALLCATLATSSALAASEVDMRGAWTIPGEFSQTTTITSMNMASGEFSGSGVATNGTGYTWPSHGIVNGREVTTWVFGPYDQLMTYTATCSGTVSADGNTVKGKCDDTFGRIGEPGTWTITREGGPPAGEEEARKAREAKEAAEKAGLRPTGTSVICNYEFATSQNVCTASVGDGGSGTPVTPTGTVSFTTASGGFANGTSCTLVATPLSPQVASCSIVYQTAFSGLPSITATYGGDARHASSSGHTQLLGAAPEESSVLEGPGPPGEFPEELTIEWVAPVPGTTIEAAVEGRDPRALPVPMKLPAIEAALDQTSAIDLRLTESHATEVDLGAAQDPTAVAAMDESLQKLTDRATELLQSPDPAKQAEGQKLMAQVAQTTQAISKMLKTQSEYTIDAVTGTKAAEAAGQHVESLEEQAIRLLQSPSPGDQAKGQQLMEEARRSFDAFTKVIQKQTELNQQAIKGTHASISRKRGVRVRTARRRAAGHRLARATAAGKLKLTMRLDAKSLRRLSRGHATLAEVLHLNVVLPSKQLAGGLPRAFVRPLTLKRTAGHVPGKRSAARPGPA